MTQQETAGCYVCIHIEHPNEDYMKYQYVKSEMAERIKGSDSVWVCKKHFGASLD